MNPRLFRKEALDWLDAPERRLETRAAQRRKVAKRRRSPRIRTPSLVQMETAECGAAALAIVLGFFRVHRPLESFREECGVSRDGTNARKLLEVARRYGFDAQGFRKEPEDLFDASMPLILHWDFNHFVVLEGISESFAWINDPERGRRRVSREEFDRSFTGPALLIRPGPDYRPRGTPPRLVPTLAEWLRGSRRAVAFLSFVGLFLVIPGLLVPVWIRLFVDEVLSRRNTDLAQVLAIGTLLTALTQGLLVWIQRNALSSLSHKLIVELSVRYLRRALRLPYSFYLARHPGDLAARVEIGERLSWLLSGDLPSAALSLVLVVSFGLMMGVTQPRLAGVVFASAVLGGMVQVVGSAPRSDRAHELAQVTARFTGLTVNGLQMIETLKANGAEDRFMTRWSSQLDDVSRARLRCIDGSEGFSSATRLFQVLGWVGVLTIGCLEISAGRMSVGTLVAFQSLMAGFFAPLGTLSSMAGRIDEIRAQVARFQDVLNHPRPIAATTRRAREIRGEVEFRDVVFGYNPLQPPILNGLSFVARPGAMVAFTGRTGSGKSTIARLASGLLPPAAGEIRVDGIPLPRLAKNTATRSIAVVEQDIQLFEGTIAENLTLWDPGIPDDALERAIHDSCLDEWIASLPEGLQTRVGEGGRGFSGGERQRIEIARALARDPRILILDEATSALDAETERRLCERLRRRNHTCLFIAHRLSAIASCDEVFHLEDGRIASITRPASAETAEVGP